MKNQSTFIVNSTTIADGNISRDENSITGRKAYIVKGVEKLFPDKVIIGGMTKGEFLKKMIEDFSNGEKNGYEDYICITDGVAQKVQIDGIEKHHLEYYKVEKMKKINCS